MRNPRRDRLEYLLYSTVMTGVTVALGLALVFGFDEHGRVRKPVLDQPLDESWREARMELREYGQTKQRQLQTWMHRKGYGDTYERWFQRRAFGGSDNNNNNNSNNSNSNEQNETKKIQDWTPPARDYSNNKPQQPRWWA